MIAVDHKDVWTAMLYIVGNAVVCNNMGGGAQAVLWQENAPEVLVAQNGASGYFYMCTVDWWSLGVIMYKCLVRYTPFDAEHPVTMCCKIMRWKQCLEILAETKHKLFWSAWTSCCVCLLDQSPG